MRRPLTVLTPAQMAAQHPYTHIPPAERKAAAAARLRAKGILKDKAS